MNSKLKPNPKKGYKIINFYFKKKIEIPITWEMKLLKVVIQIAKKRGVGNRYPYVEIGDIDLNSKTYVVKEKLSVVGCLTANKNQILVSKVRPSRGAVTRVVNNSTFVSSAFAVISSKKLKIISDDYLFFSLNTTAFFNYLESRQSGTSYPSCKNKDIENFLVFIPSLIEQQKIVSILSNIDEFISNTNKIIHKIISLKKDWMQKTLTRGINQTKFKKIKWLYQKEIEIPEDWKVLELNKISKVIDSLHLTPKYSKKGIPMIRSIDIKSEDLKIEEALCVTKEVYKKFTVNHIPQKNDIVMSRVGTYFVTSFVNIDKAFCIGQNTLVINPKIHPRFLYYALNSFYVTNQIEYSFDRTSGQKTISLKNIRKLRIFVPTAKEQEEIGNFISNINSLTQYEKEIKSKYENIKKGLMQKLLTGEIRVKV